MRRRRRRREVLKKKKKTQNYSRALQLLGQVSLLLITPGSSSSRCRLDAPLGQRHGPVRAPVLEAPPRASVVPKDQLPSEQLHGRGAVLRGGGLEGYRVPRREPVEGGAVGLGCVGFWWVVAGVEGGRKREVEREEASSKGVKLAKRTNKKSQKKNKTPFSYRLGHLFCRQFRFRAFTETVLVLLLLRVGGRGVRGRGEGATADVMEEGLMPMLRPRRRRRRGASDAAPATAGVEPAAFDAKREACIGETAEALVECV